MQISWLTYKRFVILESRMGSVKDLEIISPSARDDMGTGVFHFSDRYSVFDWGEMPDHLKNKGASLCTMSAYFFERLAEKNILNHYGYLRENDGYPTSLSVLTEPTTDMMINLVRVIKPEQREEGGKVVYDYGSIRKEHGNFVIPIEVIYRNSLPRGSSVFRRLKEGTLTLQEMGLEAEPKEGDLLPRAFVDGSTKYEEFDRYPGWKELQYIAGLSDQETSVMKAYVLAINDIISEGVRSAGFSNEDGKFEFAFTPDRGIMVVDTLGTLDECRFTYNGTDVSKEIPRQWYKHSQPDWVAEIDAAKKANRKEWKKLVESRPDPLPPALKEILENLYPAVANAVIERQLFSGIPSVGEVVYEYAKFKAANMR